MQSGGVESAKCQLQEAATLGTLAKGGVTCDIDDGMDNVMKFLRKYQMEVP